jgi:hypothetical protein
MVVEWWIDWAPEAMLDPAGMPSQLTD